MSPWLRWLVLGALAVSGSAWAGRRAPRALQLSGVVNLNEATADELDHLPGVGPKAVKRILEYRARQPFKRIEELVRVKGFGRKRFAKMRIHLVLAGPTTLKVEPIAASGP